MLNWNEIRSRATSFSHEWAGETRETGEYQAFWEDFFHIFNIKRRTLAVYQQRVDLLGGSRGFIDLFWPGTLLVEHKTAGENLEKATTQATDYFLALPEEKRPRYIIVTDYARMRLYDLDLGTEVEFGLSDLPNNIRRFAFIAGYAERSFREENPVNAKAVKAVAKLYDSLLANNYPQDYIAPLLVRLVFCFFADDAGIFAKKDTLKDYLQYMAREDGSDLGQQLALIFQVLDTPEDQRQANLDEDLATLPYVNGGLFKDPMPFPAFNAQLRQTLLQAMDFDWGEVSPAIFGSMFQSVMSGDQRHDLGAHYTSASNIRRLINPLFMDGLREEFRRAGRNTQKLLALQKKMGELKFLDPACGCGNFLVVAYQDLRELEMEIIKILYAPQIEKGLQMLGFSIASLSKLSVSQMHGIEIEKFPSLIASLALWLTDHQMNMKLGTLFGEFFAKLPLQESPHIVQADALLTDWKDVVAASDLNFIMGNPPFLGARIMSLEQKAALQNVFYGTPNSGNLDFVTAWYKKAAEFIQGTGICAAFVSTNSITQGEQVGILWPPLLGLGVKIRFAHRTFRWSNESANNAAVFCVIVGFGLEDPERVRLFDYENPSGDPHEIEVKRLNPYLTDGPDIIVQSRQKPLDAVPEIGIGNKPIDGGHYLFSREEMEAFIAREPKSQQYFRPWFGAEEFLQNKQRWCLWVGDADPADLQSMPAVLERIRAVQEYRRASVSAPTRALADTPTRFHVENMPAGTYLLIPSVSSERRRYIPIGFFGPDAFASNLVLIISGATLFHFGVLQSAMHMAWVRAVAGRLKSDYRYSKDVVYNNFPWPGHLPTDETSVAELSQNVLDVRARYEGTPLGTLYNPETMPADLVRAHRDLDKAVDSLYRKTGFKDDSERLAFLLDLYQQKAGAR